MTGQNSINKPIAREIRAAAEQKLIDRKYGRSEEKREENAPDIQRQTAKEDEERGKSAVKAVAKKAARPRRKTPRPEANPAPTADTPTEDGTNLQPAEPMTAVDEPTVQPRPQQ